MPNSKRELLLLIYFYFHLSRTNWKNIISVAGADFEYAWKIAQSLEPRRESFPKKLQDAFIDLPVQEAITDLDIDYPTSWLDCASPPLVVYFIGRREIINPASSVAIVGTRKPSGFGQSNATYFSDLAARAKFTIVSGLASGIDTIAHQSALSYQTKTIAFIGSGFGKLYPKENTLLAEKIIQTGGTLFSEYPSDISPKPFHFPIRNRLIAASANTTLIIEAAAKSGAFITGKLAADLGKNLLVLTQDYRNSAGMGANRLIQEANASPVLDGKNFLEILGRGLGGLENTVLDNAMQEYRIADLQKEWGLDFPATVQKLMNELAHGRWKALGGDRFTPISIYCRA